MDVAVAIVAAVGLMALISTGIRTLRRRAQRAGTYGGTFVYVDDSGRVRELTAREIEHLNTDFEFGDGNAPYIKSSYYALTFDGRIGGYLPRRKLPRDVQVRAVAQK